MEKARETFRRCESDLQKDIVLLQKSEVESKRLNEEFKKKVSVNLPVVENTDIFYT